MRRDSHSHLCRSELRRVPLHIFSLKLYDLITFFSLVRTAEYDEIQETLEEIAKENTLLKEKAKQADVLTEVLQELVGEAE